MNGRGAPPGGRDQSRGGPDQSRDGRDQSPGGRDPSQPRPPGEGWAILSYMIGGMALYGFVGWLAARWTGWPGLFPIGMLVGLASGIALVIFRVTRS